MNCEKCGYKSTVIDTRNDRSFGKNVRNEEGTVFRRRKCLKCDFRWSTQEIRTENGLDLNEEQLRNRLNLLKKSMQNILDKF